MSQPEVRKLTLLPPNPAVCQVCAADHQPEVLHNRQSLYYQTVFFWAVGRSPTWADAMAHCNAADKAEYEARLKQLGYWAEPPEGQSPVPHIGDDSSVE